MRLLSILLALLLTSFAAFAQTSAPAPPAPFTDYRYEKPGTVRKITPKDLPKPFATSSHSDGPAVHDRPANVMPQAPAGFKVELYTTRVEQPRKILTAPNGDFFVAEMEPGNIRVFRGVTSDGKSWSNRTLKFGGKGLQSVTTDWKVGLPGKTVNAWIQLKTLAPNQKTSSKTSFLLHCAK